MSNNKDMKNVFNILDELLGSTNLDDVSAESSGFLELKEGYYLCEVKKAELKVSKSSGSPMAAFQFKVIEDGTFMKFDSKDRPTPVKLKGTKNRIIFKYFVFKDESSVKRFAADMMKFEGDEPGKSFLEKECFTNSELIEDAMDLLIGMHIYIHITVNVNDDNTTSSWPNLISWKTAGNLGLKVD